jgi:hypothetical protein
MHMPISMIDPADIRQRGAIAGVIAAAVMVAVNLADMAVTKQRTNDIRLVGGLFPGARRAWPVFGTGIHLLNGAALGSLFALVQHGLPGPTWARGVIFGLVENFLLWPFLLMTDRIHPDVKTGKLDRYNRPGPFAAATFRHIVYGAVLGAAYDRLTKQTRRT